MPDSKLIAIVQARMGSTRLPGKVMLKLAGSPVLTHVVRRTAKSIPYVVVATSCLPEDDVIEQHCRVLDIPVVRCPGNSMDVYSRYRLAVQQHRCESFLRITADCPLIEPQVLQVVAGAICQTDKWDYASTAAADGFVDGLDCEGVSTRVFLDTDPTGMTDFEKEHVTPRFRNGRYRWWLPPDDVLTAFRRDPNVYRLTLDTPQDYEFLLGVYARFGPDPNTEEIIAWLDSGKPLRN